VLDGKVRRLFDDTDIQNMGSGHQMVGPAMALLYRTSPQLLDTMRDRKLRASLPLTKQRHAASAYAQALSTSRQVVPSHG